ncbi:MAG TPA: protein kinase, partial [Thermoleophilaceae bacterium]|nr:protein kinase [Thermoleophilaceae bacterium]
MPGDGGERGRLGEFTIEAEIGRGGMGVVYLAHQPSLDRRVALKVIVPELSEDPAFRDRFEREARHVASLDHPNIVPIFGAGEADGRLYIAM